MDEFEDRMKEAGLGNERKKPGKKRVVIILGTFLVLGVLTGTYIAVAMNQDTYWKPEGILRGLR